MTHKREYEEVVWTETLSDRRLSERRSGLDRRELLVGQALHVPDPRSVRERRSAKRREQVTLVITGRAMEAGDGTERD